MSDHDIEFFDLSDVEWGIAKNILNILEAVDGVTIILSDEKYSTLSWCLPILIGLRDIAKCDEHDSVILTGIKKKLTHQLNERFQLDELKVNSCAILSTALDPRFRKLAFLTSQQWDELHEILVDKANSKCSSSSLDKPLVKKKKKSMLDRLLGEDEEEKDRGNSVTDEVFSYLKERPIKRTDDPFMWWRVNATRYT